ncbi:glycerophosphodiester phosphodiesterase gde1 [Acrodontium crateriforme]|uniref:Glycerophosphodiester phosphodiesterase gde1 n=1 Tax=Acrodontium crateriforme TaxID=150365 RepID=A0AAQ3RCS4_9PEZI|nr:glycerophosphodiester phosphodiesterase gde1 [Acrodontium crateriforme]
MKFGQNLSRNQVPEWASSYIDYKGLKKLIKAAQQCVVRGEEPDLTGFSFTLDRQVENVDTFYNRKCAECSRRLRLLYDRYGMVSKMHDGMDKDEMEDLKAALLELRGQLRKLTWYGEVNRRGFIKITKKLDKKIPSSSAQKSYLATMIDPKPFATNNKLTLDLRAINEWLSSLNDVKINDDSSSVHSGSSASVHRMSSRSTMKIPTITLEALDHAVRDDHVQIMSELLSNAIPATIPPIQRNSILLDLLQRAITCKATACIKDILARDPSIDQDHDMNKRNFLHKLVIAIGRARALQLNQADGNTDNSRFINAAKAPVRTPDAFKIEERDPDSDIGKDERAEQLLVFLLEHLSVEQRQAILAKDIYGRLPLHYAAQYGLVTVTQELISKMYQWKLFDISDGIDGAAWQDIDGLAPLHLAVQGGHLRTTQALLLVDTGLRTETTRLTHVDVDKTGAALELATKNNFHKIVQLLVDAGVNVNYQDVQGETALHIAARWGHVECARVLLATSGPQAVKMELAENTYGWTPLFTACVDGHLNIVELLITKGAEISAKDWSGWTPQEHASLRGHLDIARRLAQLTPPPSLRSSPEISAQVASNAASLEDRRSNGVSKEAGARPSETVKTFGHRYLTDESMVLVSLGTMDNRKELESVILENIPLTNAHATQLDTALSIVISAQGATGEPTVIDLPVQENISTSPITFMTKTPSAVKILFDLVPTYAGTTSKVIGRAVALLNSIKPTIGTQRMNLQGDLKVPLVSATTLDIIGAVNFNFLIITPFHHQNMTVSEERTYWRESSTMVIGHRGLGKNMAAKTSLQLGENTMESFIQAASLGASYVEFDVQITKDHVPVIYHDFLVSETGADVPVHTLTLEQFLALKETAPQKALRKAHALQSSNTKSKAPGDDNEPLGRTHRSHSWNGTQEDIMQDLRDRMKHTRDFKKKGFKGNSRGDSIQASFATLEQMFRTLDPSIGFNIEMKYPMLFETEQEGMDTYAVELNSFVDTVLSMVYALVGSRSILFSSFHPDICLLLSFKQPNFPVLFLTDAGSAPVGDIRASSLQEAIRFASRWKLLGLVSASEPFVLCPRLVQVVRNSGLVCMSYGTLNNDPHNARLQAQEGIDAVIVDSVARVRKGLSAKAEEDVAVVKEQSKGVQEVTDCIREGVKVE